MNIKITKKEFESFINNEVILYKGIIGSRLYKTNKDDSDFDILIMYEKEFKSDILYPNYHQFQYDDVENNTQYMLISKRHFFKNLFSGDATINADIIMFDSYPLTSKSDILNTVRTYNIIKAYIGFAKRDIKDYLNKRGKNKMFHIERGLYCAEELLNGRLPDINKLKEFGNGDINELKEKEDILRKKCNEMFDNGELTMYPKNSIIEPENDLERRLIEANNIKEFKY